MYNNATFVTKEQLKFLKQMDNWLANEPWQSEVELEIAMQVREMITKIEEKGYYYEGEAELLNLMREEFIKNKKLKKVKGINHLDWSEFNKEVYEKVNLEIIQRKYDFNRSCKLIIR